jgi:hypothetical protein
VGFEPTGMGCPRYQGLRSHRAPVAAIRELRGQSLASCGPDRAPRVVAAPKDPDLAADGGHGPGGLEEAGVADAVAR